MFGTARVSREVLHPLMEVDEPLCSAADALSTVLVGEGASRVPGSPRPVHWNGVSRWSP